MLRDGALGLSNNEVGSRSFAYPEDEDSLEPKSN